MGIDLILFLFPFVRPVCDLQNYFSAFQRWQKQSDKAEAEKYARQRRGRFLHLIRGVAGIGKIGTARYLRGKIIPRRSLKGWAQKPTAKRGRKMRTREKGRNGYRKERKRRTTGNAADLRGDSEEDRITHGIIYKCRYLHIGTFYILIHWGFLPFSVARRPGRT